MGACAQAFSPELRELVRDFQEKELGRLPHPGVAAKDNDKGDDTTCLAL